MTYYYDDELYHYDDELYHHGVKGMKWGVRKARRYIGNGVSRIRRKTSQFYNKHRRAINTAAGIAGAAALGYGAYRLDKATGGRGARLVRSAGSRVGSAARNAYGNVANSRFGRSASSLKSRASYAWNNSGAVRGLRTAKRNAGNTAHRLWRDAKIAGGNVGSRIGSAARTYGSKVGSAARTYGSKVGSAARTYGSKVGSAVKNSYVGTNLRDIGYTVGQKAGRFKRQAGVTIARTYNTAKRKLKRRG